MIIILSIGGGGPRRLRLWISPLRRLPVLICPLCASLVAVADDRHALFHALLTR